MLKDRQWSSRFKTVKAEATVASDDDTKAPFDPKPAGAIHFHLEFLEEDVGYLDSPQLSDIQKWTSHPTKYFSDESLLRIHLCMADFLPTLIHSQSICKLYEFLQSLEIVGYRRWLLRIQRELQQSYAHLPGFVRIR